MIHRFLPVVALALLPVTVSAQDERPLGWSDQAEFSFVASAGNASASTLGLKNTLEYAWPEALFRFVLGGVRTESARTTRTAVGTPGDFRIVEDEDSELTAENYVARLRYERNLSDRFFAQGGVTWERNQFAGIDSRYGAVAGLGRIFYDREDLALRADLGVTYTREDPVTPDPDTDDSFLGLRAQVGLRAALTETTEWESELVVDENLDSTDDLRAGLTNSVSVSISDGLALKTSLGLNYDNLPALEEIPLEGTSEVVLAPLDELDGVLTVALVITF